MLRVLCYGGRHYAAAECVDWALSHLAQQHGKFLVVNGGARGADALCKQWGLRHGHPVITMDAAWEALGNSAGHKRNQWMLDYAAPNYALAFPGGPGTADMTRRVKLAGLPLWEPFK
jgi:hypothetical protein